MDFKLTMAFKKTVDKYKAPTETSTKQELRRLPFFIAAEEKNDIV